MNQRTDSCCAHAIGLCIIRVLWTVLIVLAVLLHASRGSRLTTAQRLRWLLQPQAMQQLIR
jgi:hypothetical protein